MKCNKCLKIIPKGEEIKMYGNGGEYGKKGSYGGCYCGECWKTKWEYKTYEDGKMTPTKNNSDIKMPLWGIVLLAIFVSSTIILALLLWTEKNN